MVPDYYAMLGVEPRADRDAIEQALARCQPVWSSGTRNPKNKHTYQSYLDQIPAIRRALLGDSASRAAYDAELAESRRAERDRALDRLTGLVKLRSAKGGLTVSDRTLLRDRARSLGLADDDLERLIEAIPPRPEPPRDDDAPDPPVDALDTTTRKQIRVALDHLGRRDLYDALGLSRDAPGREVADRTAAERQRWMHKSQVTAEKTAWLEIIAYAQSHLSGAAERARYDRTLALDAEEAFQDAAAFAVEGLDRLDPGTRSALMDEGASRGIAPDRAERLIRRACRQKGVARDFAPTPAGTGPPRLLRCRSCGGVTDFDRLSRGGAVGSDCRHCGADLRWQCPLCQRSRWVDEPRCACGFPLANREPLLRHLDAAHAAYKGRDLDTALGHLTRVLDFAPGHPGATKGISRIRERRAEVARARSAWEAARSARRMVAAHDAVAAWERVVGKDDRDVQAAWSEVVRALHNARAAAARAKLLEASNPKAARDLYRQALESVADLPEAQQGLRRCPPDPPMRLSARLVEGAVRLDWSPPPPDGLGPPEYRVVRKLGGVPATASDGERLAEVDATTFEDRTAPPGLAAGYAVFAARGEALSPAGAIAGPVLVLGEVSDLRLEARSHEVHLRWTPPPRAVEIRVVRKVGSPPSGPDDGERVDAQLDSAWDRGLADDRVYHYGVFAAFRGPDDARRFGGGTFASALPSQPLPPLEPPTLSRLPDGSLGLEWPPPPRGFVKLVRTARPIGLPPGVTASTAEVEALGGTWIDPDGAGRATDTRPPETGQAFYTPMVQWAGTWTVGRPAAFSSIPDPSDLRVVRAGGSVRLHLRWRWSPRGTHSLIVYRAGTPPTGPDDLEALATLVSEAEYSRQGYLALTLPPEPRGPWHVAVYATATVEGTRVVSPGLDPTARTVVPGPNPEVTLSYVLRKAGFAGRSWTLTFRTDPPGAALPATVLVAHDRTVPLSVDDGAVVARFPGSADGASFSVRSDFDLGRGLARVFTDPHAEPDGLPPIRIRHPEAGRVRA